MVAANRKKIFTFTRLLLLLAEKNVCFFWGVDVAIILLFSPMLYWKRVRTPNKLSLLTAPLASVRPSTKKDPGIGIVCGWKENDGESGLGADKKGKKKIGRLKK